MKIKKWLERNSSALQAVAAIIAICGVLIAIPIVWRKAFKADLLLQVDFTETTVPPGLLDWAENLRRLLPEDEGKPAEKNSVSEALRQLRSSPVSERLKTWHFYDDGIDKLTLTLRNQTDHTLTGIRIRVSNMDRLWSTDVHGTYLTSDEAAAFEKNLSSRTDNRAVVIPELPPIPPDGILIITLYGKSFRPEVNLAASGVSTKTETFTKVKDNWFISLYNDPWPIVFLAPAAVALMLFLSQIRITKTNEEEEEEEETSATVTATEKKPESKPLQDKRLAPSTVVEQPKNDEEDPPTSQTTAAH